MNRAKLRGGVGYWDRGKWVWRKRVLRVERMTEWNMRVEKELEGLKCEMYRVLPKGVARVN